MGWSLETSLETADALQARGWGVATRRTTYRRHRFAAADARLTALVLALTALSVAGAVCACGGFAFYPVVGPWTPWVAYVPLALLVLLPVGLELKEALVWRDAR